MKNILKIAFSFYLLLSSFYFQAQVPQKFNYQGIARDTKGNPLAKQIMSLKIIVLPTSDASEGEYEEMQSVTTNEFGLYNLQIGNGTALKGEMKTVKWETGNKYIKVMIDPAGGSNFVDAGTTQLLSVPYAIYADKAGMAKTTASSDRAGSVSTSASGTGTVNFLTKFTAANTIYNSQLFDNGTNIGIGTITPSAKLHINQNLGSVQEHFRMQNLSATGAGRFTLYSDATTNYSTFTKYGSAFAGSYAGLTGLYPFGNLLAFGNNGLAANDGLGRFLISSAGNAGISIFKGGTSKLKFHADFTTENVGIGGNAAPVSRVHLNNTDGTNMDLRLTNTTSGHTATDGMVLSQNGNTSSLINRENGELQFGSNNIVSMKLVPSGNLELTNQIKIAGGNPGTGKVLTSDSVGMASWQTIATSNQWVTNGTHIYNSNTGNVGIGTNTPTSPLHVASPFSEIRLQNTAINTSLFITAPFNGGTGGIGTNGNYELPFFTNNIERLVIKNDGKVGIGTNTPTSPLHLASPVSEIRLHNTAINASLFITAPFNGGTGGIGTNGNYELPFYTNSIERVVIKNDGKVGVGTSSPTAKLDVNGQVKIAGGNPGAGKVLTSDTNGLASWELQPISWNIDGNANTNQANHFIGTVDAQSLNFRVNNKLSGRIDSSQASSFFGFRAGGNSISNSNSAFGYKSLFSNVTGNQNVAFGVEALFMNVSGGSNVAVGNASLKNIVSGVSNTAIGNNALYELKSGGYNTALGFEALHSDTLSYYNTAIGSLSISNNIHGVSNTAIGHSSLINNSTGSSNVAVGVSALSGNISGSSNTAIGENSFINGGFFNNSTALGAFANITASNQVRIGNASVSSIGGQVGWSTLSDLRLKNNINPIKLGLNFILDLNPVTYSYISDNNNTIYSGFLAQEVEAAAQQHGVKFSGVDAPKNENDFYSLRYAEFTVPLVKSVQELNGEIDLLKKQNQSLQQQIDELKALIKK